MTRKEAVRSFTTWNAFAYRQERDLGSLEVGKQADVVVLSEDVLRCDEIIPPVRDRARTLNVSPRTGCMHFVALTGAGGNQTLLRVALYWPRRLAMALDVEVARRLFTVEEYHGMAETGILGEDERVELIVSPLAFPDVSFAVTDFFA